MIGHALSLLIVLVHCSNTWAHVAQQPIQPQVTLNRQQTFHETSIYRPLKSPSTLDAPAAALAPAEFHIYDNFGKDVPMPGIATFAHLNWTNCFTPENDGTFDIGIVGMPFDLGVSYRPGQRFGPAATRAVSQRMGPSIGYRRATTYSSQH